LSLLVGLIDQKAVMEGTGGHAEHSSAVRAVVNYCGPTDLSHEFRDVKAVQPFLKALCGGTPESASAAYQSASPVTYVSKEGPPVLSVHGDQDDIVPVNQAKMLDEVMKKQGGRHELLILTGQGHAFEGEPARQVEQTLWAFFDKHLKAR
jgi:dipeptidyl aminopeptidase/acylaminoacyl peptidase